MLVIKCKQEHKIVQVGVSPPHLENAVLFRYSPTPSSYNLPTFSPKMVLESGERVCYPFVAEPPGVTILCPRPAVRWLFSCVPVSSQQLWLPTQDPHKTHTRPIQASQCSSMEWEGVHEAQPLTDKFWAIHSSWKRETLLRVWLLFG